MGKLYVVATPIGNLSDISERALKILGEVDFIAVEDTRQTVKILNHFNIKKQMTAYHKFNEKSKSGAIIEKILNGSDVALVSDAGTPCISDPGYELVKLARENKIEVIGIPGPSAIITALSISGLDTSNFTFIGFLPVDNKKLREKIEQIKKSSFSTFIIYESPKRLLKLVELLKENFMDSKIFIASDLTKIHERSFFGNIEEVYDIIKNDEKIEKGEYVVVLEKKLEKIELVEKKDYSIEAELIDIIVKEKCDMKTAIKILNEKNKNLKKNDIYNASLNIKKIFN